MHEHQVLCRVLDAAATYGQLNFPSMKWAELVVRRMDVIKEAHRAAPANPDYSSADLFMGWGSQAVAGGTNPALASHVATQLKDQAAIAKGYQKSPRGAASPGTWTRQRPWSREGRPAARGRGVMSPLPPPGESGRLPGGSQGRQAWPRRSAPGCAGTRSCASFWTGCGRRPSSRSVSSTSCGRC